MYKALLVEKEIVKLEEDLRVLKILEKNFSENLKSLKTGDIYDAYGYEAIKEIDEADWGRAKILIDNLFNNSSSDDTERLNAILCVYGKLNKSIILPDGEEICGWKIVDMGKMELVEKFNKKEILMIYYSGL